MTVAAMPEELPALVGKRILDEFIERDAALHGDYNAVRVYEEIEADPEHPARGALEWDDAKLGREARIRQVQSRIIYVTRRESDTAKELNRPRTIYISKHMADPQPENRGVYVPREVVPESGRDRVVKRLLEQARTIRNRAEEIEPGLFPKIVAEVSAG